MRSGREVFYVQIFMLKWKKFDRKTAAINKLIYDF